MIGRFFAAIKYAHLYRDEITTGPDLADQIATFRSAAALSRALLGRPMDWTMPRFSQISANVRAVGVVSLRANSTRRRL